MQLRRLLSRFTAEFAEHAELFPEWLGALGVFGGKFVALSC